jgi:RHS repeat-associated protein
VEKSSGSSAGQTIHYVYDRKNILAILDSSNNPLIVFTHGPSVDEPLLAHRSNTDYSIHDNALGSVRVHTSTSGDVAEYITYEAFGAPTFIDVHTGSTIFSSNSFTGSPYGFTATPFDFESGLYLHDKRYRDPTSGRFVSADPLGFGGGDVNLYAYVLNQPTNWNDPGGTASPIGPFTPTPNGGGVANPPSAIGGFPGGIPGQINFPPHSQNPLKCPGNAAKPESRGTMTCGYLGERLFGLCVYGCWDENGNDLGKFSFAPNKDGSCRPLIPSVPIPPNN